MVGPFIFFDHFGPADFARGIPRTVDVRPHPHIGLSTVTYLFEGEIMHRDSVGSEQAIRPGEVNWMVAGRGITHSERFEKARAEGGPMHGIQAWVALPREHEETPPQFANYSGDALPTRGSGDTWMRLVAGEIDGVRAGAVTHSPIFYAHVKLEQAATLSLPANTLSARRLSCPAASPSTGATSKAGRCWFSRRVPTQSSAPIRPRL